MSVAESIAAAAEARARQARAEPEAPRPGDTYVQSFARGLGVIRSFSASAPQQTLSEVAQRTGLTRAGAREAGALRDFAECLLRRAGAERADDAEAARERLHIGVAGPRRFGLGPRLAGARFGGGGDGFGNGHARSLSPAACRAAAQTLVRPSGRLS